MGGGGGGGIKYIIGGRKGGPLKGVGRGRGECDSRKKPAVKNLVTLSLEMVAVYVNP
jgi:hypothetical protein